MISNPKMCDEAATVEDVRRLFLDSHVHAALITRGRLLIAVIERSDLGPHQPDTASVARFGRLRGRVVAADEALAPVHRRMLRTNRRRLAVISTGGELIGLLCLKRSLTGFCSDQDVDARMTDRATDLLVTACADKRPGIERLPDLRSQTWSSRADHPALSDTI
jgi:CBS domain-containing protein